MSIILVKQSHLQEVNWTNEAWIFLSCRPYWCQSAGHNADQPVGVVEARRYGRGTPSYGVKWEQGRLSREAPTASDSVEPDVGGRGGCQSGHLAALWASCSELLDSI